MAELYPPARPNWEKERCAQLEPQHDPLRLLVMNLIRPRPFGSTAFLQAMDERLSAITDAQHGPRVAFMPLALPPAVDAYVDALSFHRDFKHHVKSPHPWSELSAAQIQAEGNRHEAEYRIDGWGTGTAHAGMATRFFAKAAKQFFPNRAGRNELVEGLTQATANLAQQWNRKTLFVKFQATGTEERESELHQDNPQTDYVAIFYLNKKTYPAFHRQPGQKPGEAVMPPKQSLAVWRGQGLDNPSWHAAMGANVTGLRVVVYSQAGQRAAAYSGKPGWRQGWQDWRKTRRLSTSALRET